MVDITCNVSMTDFETPEKSGQPAWPSANSEAIAAGLVTLSSPDVVGSKNRTDVKSLRQSSVIDRDEPQFQPGVYREHDGRHSKRAMSHGRRVFTNDVPKPTKGRTACGSTESTKRPCVRNAAALLRASPDIGSGWCLADHHPVQAILR